MGVATVALQMSQHEAGFFFSLLLLDVKFSPLLSARSRVRHHEIPKRWGEHCGLPENCLFILEVQRQRDQFAVVLRWMRRRFSHPSCLYWISILSLRSQSVWVATLNQRVCNLQLTERFKCERKKHPNQGGSLESSSSTSEAWPFHFWNAMPADCFHFHTVDKFSCQVIWISQNFKTTITSQWALKRASPVHL